jgi:hypothetical protein
MPLFRRTDTTSRDRKPPEISAETDVRRAIHHGVDRRRPRRPTFGVLCAVPQVIGASLSSTEHGLAARTIAEHLRDEDQFCALDDGSYLVVLQRTDEDHAAVVAQRLAVELTLRSGAVNQRTWRVGLARYPHDARTEAALIDLARSAALERGAA